MRILLKGILMVGIVIAVGLSGRYVLGQFLSPGWAGLAGLIPAVVAGLGFIYLSNPKEEGKRDDSGL